MTLKHDGNSTNSDNNVKTRSGSLFPSVNSTIIGHTSRCITLDDNTLMWRSVGVKINLIPGGDYLTENQILDMIWL